jgi:glycosyltransferase involved in cell wall biosynthesis
MPKARPNGRRHRYSEGDVPQTSRIDEGKKKLILLCGPIAAPGKPAAGGFQSNNRRIGEILRRRYEVRELAYPEGAATRLGKAMAYLKSFSHIGWHLLTLGARPAALHFTPLAQMFLPAEVIFCLIAKLRGIQIVLDLRAGTHLTDYESKSGFYRFAYRLLLRQASIISYEGEVYADLVARLAPATPSWYFPNFLEPAALPATMPERMPPLSLIYVGRVSFAKGALHAARCLAHLQKAEPAATLTLVGGIDEDCRAAIAALSIPHIRFTGPLPPEAVRSLLDRAHFFLFLSQWWGEGHSNALTEAMGRGCVPVYTLHGFNEAVAGSTGIPVAQRDETAGIAEGILAIWRMGRWRGMGEDAHRRVTDRFSSRQAEETLDEIYSALWNAEAA